MAFRVVALLVFAALAALAYWALGADDGAPPVSTSSVVDPAQANAQVPLSAVGGSADEESRTDAGGTQRPQAQGLRIDSNTVFGVVELRVIVEHEGGNAPAESFRWTAVGTAMGIEPRGLRCDVGPQAKQSAAGLIHHLKGAQIKIAGLINH